MSKLNYKRKTNRKIDYWNAPKKVTKADLSNRKFKMPFGKYVGLTVQQTYNMNPSYIKWLKQTL